MSRSTSRQALLGLAVSLLAAGAHAGTFSVSPVRVSLSAAQRVQALKVRNDGIEPAVVQLEVVGWSQLEGGDAYAPTADVLATPPIFTIAPGATQLVRVGLRRVPDGQRELTYRLHLQEVPPPPKPGFRGLAMALRVSLPVFVAAPAAAPVMHWQATRNAQGDVNVRLANDGNAHVQVGSLQLSAPGGTGLASRKVAAYVLAGQSRDWTLRLDPPPQAGAVLRLAAQTDAGEVNADLRLESAADR
jgi:fimbrial chaperone protein